MSLGTGGLELLACAVCVSLTRDDLGLFWSALFLTTVPFAVAGVLGGWLFYHLTLRRRR